ncbi:MAG: HAMP domain-containing histidine kinase [Sphingomonas sp.]|nr:MAG: HAMP domain-containing histidine kinase [Sphingomonas sp.]
MTLFAPAFTEPRFSSRIAPLVPTTQDLPWLVGYACAFLGAHHVAAEWGGHGFYSLLYPAAGFRMALLWLRGPRLAGGVIATEVFVQCATGVIDPASAEWLIQLVGVIRPPLVYALVVLLVRAGARRAGGTRVTGTLAVASRGTTSMSVAPMPLGLASVGAPVAAALTSVPWSLLRPDLTGVTGLRDIVASLAGFVVGDLLGVLLLTPPLLWLVELATSTTGMAARPTRPGIASVTEVVLVLAASFATEAVLATIGLGTPHTPVLLAVAWIGLRFGRTASWLSIVVVAAMVLPQTAMPMPTGERLSLHMSLASILVVGYLAGSFADAQARMRIDLGRRDRLLFQAERLKTLRAMSVAVIHEISQPLSTLAIEAKHLHELTVSADPEIASTAALIDRKAAALSTLVRRLRRFGGRIVDQPTPLPLATLIATVAALAQPEAKARNVTLSIEPVDPDLVVLAQEVELAQAIVNLVRNAVQASGREPVRLIVEAEGDRARIVVINHPRPDRLAQPGMDAPDSDEPGMGVGVLVARAIVEAYGGSLTRGSDARGELRATIILPLMRDAE